MKISLITVTLNSGKTIESTIQSVLMQTFADIEYIIIDGLSKDNTIDIVKKYKGLFNGRLKWISEKDRGIYDAMNKGIKMATGDIVGIINSDDFYHKCNLIERVAEAFQNSSIQSVYGDVRFVDANNLEKTVRYYSSKWFTTKLFRFGFMPAHPTFFTYKVNFEKYGYYKTDYKIAADYELLIRFLFVHRIKSEYLGIDFLKMRIGGISTSSVKNNILLNKEIVKACRENDIWTCVPLLIVKYLFKAFGLVFTRN